MIDPEEEALLHAAIDGGLTAPQQDALDRLLERSSSARERRAELEYLARRLDELGPAEPPTDLTRHVMDAVVRKRRTPGQFVAFNGGMGMSKRVMFSLAAAAAVVLGVFVIKGYPPIGSGTEGSIGAAKRYQAPQMAAGDVKLGDASAQEFLQSDVFDRLMKDETSRKALLDPAVQAMFGDPALSQALRAPELVAAFNSAAFQAALNKVEFRLRLEDASFRDALSDADVQAALQSMGFSEAFSKAFNEPALAAALDSAAVRMALSNEGFRALLGDANFLLAMSDANMQAALQTNGFVAALQSDAFQSALRDRQ